MEAHPRVVKAVLQFYHFDDEPDPVPNSHHSEISDLDQNEHQSEKSDPDTH